MLTMSFFERLEQHALNTPSAIAYIDEDKKTSYSELLNEVNRLSALLLANGAKTGDMLALWLPTGKQWFALFLACSRIGITVLALNTRFKGHEVGDLIKRSNARWLVMWPTFKQIPFVDILNEVDEELISHLESIILINSEDTEFKFQNKKIIHYEKSYDYLLDDYTPAPPSAGAIIYTTSGTTSKPKLVLHNQITLMTHGYDVTNRFNVGSKDVTLLGAPLCGAFGFSAALGAFYSGSTIVSAPILNPLQCLQQIDQYQVTHVHANNELLNLILDEADKKEHQHLSLDSLKLVGFGSFSPSLIDFPRRAENKKLPLVALYGSSELQALSASQDLEDGFEQRVLAGGRLTSPDGFVRARDLDTNELLPHGEVGEIEIKSPTCMVKYLNNAEATEEAVDNEGYFKTGDLGYTVSEQRFVFKARKGDFLRLGGFLVNPVEIQEFIQKIPGVEACQLVSVDVDHKPTPVAFVIMTNSYEFSEEKIIAHCKKELAGFKVPKKIIKIDKFPMVESANSNKIQRNKLVELADKRLNNF